MSTFSLDTKEIVIRILTQVTSPTCVKKCDVFVDDTRKIVRAKHQGNAFRHNVEKCRSERYRNSTAQNDKSKLDAKRPNFIKVSFLYSSDNVSDVKWNDEVRNRSQDEPDYSLEKVNPFSFQIFEHP